MQCNLCQLRSSKEATVSVRGAGLEHLTEQNLHQELLLARLPCLGGVMVTTAANYGASKDHLDGGV